MFNRLLVSLFTSLFLLLAIFSVTLPAQDIARAVAIKANSQVAGVAGLQSRITIDLTAVPLRQSLEEVAQQAALKISITHSASQIDKRVTLHARDITVGDAFQSIIARTPVRMTVASDGRVVFDVLRAQAPKMQSVIVGKVTDSKTGHGIAGASVSTSIETKGVITGEDGSYRLTGIAAGPHVITVRLVGYAKQTRSIIVGEGATVTADFKLEPSASVLDQVVVTGTVVQTELKAVPNAITVITAKQIEERGITRIDQLFRGDIPGLFSVNVGSGALLDEVTMFSRGATTLFSSSPGASSINGTFTYTNPIKTYIDGVEMADPKYLSQIDPKTIERIEILTGPQASTIYGANAINGVMQVFTKRGTGNKPQLTVGISSGIAENDFSSHLAPNHLVDASVTGIEGKWSYNVGGSWNYLGSWTPSKQTQRLTANGGGRMDLGKFNTDISARRGTTLNRQRGEMTQFLTNLRATGVQNLNTATQGLPAPQDQRLNNTTLGLALGYRATSWWSHDMILGSDMSATETITTAPRFQNAFDTTLRITSSNSSRISQRYSTTATLPLSSFGSVNVTVGGDHWRTTSSSWAASPITLTGSFPSTAFPNITRTPSDKNIGAFVQGQLGIRESLFFTYGLREDWNPNFGDRAKVRPGRYGVSYSRDIDTPFGALSTKLRGSYGRSIRPPYHGAALALANTNTAVTALFGNFDVLLANPDLVPEDQRGGEGGVEFYFGSRSSLVVTRYNQTVTNLIGQANGIDSVRSLASMLLNTTACSSTFFDDEGRCFRYQSIVVNIGDIRNQGWEMQGSINTGPFSTRGTYTWAKSRIIGLTPKYKNLGLASQVKPGNPFDFMPEHTWALGVTYNQSSSMMSLSLNGVGQIYGVNTLSLMTNAASRINETRARIFLPIGGYRTTRPGYTTADLNASHRFSKRIEASLQVTNLTNYYQSDFAAQYASLGRQTKIGSRWRF